jgi:hypothetical protein
MDLPELKERGLELLRTCRDRLEEYGRAFNEIWKMCNNYAGPKLSDSILISDIAYSYVEKERSLYNLTKNEKHLMHIKAANELYITERISFDDIHKVLDKYKRKIDFDEAKEILKQEDFYNSIHPDTLNDVLHFIELNLEE